jgi:AbrB family looped-hinge helix DNA binding protein
MSYKAKVTKGWKISIPSACRKHLNLNNGEEVLFDIRDNEVVMLPMKAFLEKARQKIAYFHPSNESLVEKLLIERKKEAAND